MSELDLPIRGRTYEEPEEPHIAIVRGSDIDVALDHIDLRPDCRALAVLGAPDEPPDLELLGGRRLFVSDADGDRMRALVEAGEVAGAEVEWYRGPRVPFDRIAAWALPVGAVVLAAGRASVLGRDKLLLEVGGRALVRRAIESATEGGCQTVHAVYADEGVRAEIGDEAVPVLNPEAASRGPISSIQIGLQSMPEDVAGALVLLGDQPLVGAGTVRRLLRCWRQEGTPPALAADYGDGWRPPLLLDRCLWPDVYELRGPEDDLAALLRARPGLLGTAPAEGRADDVDTSDDYARIVQLFGRQGTEPSPPSSNGAAGGPRSPE
ncbi:MAG TPA: nucleotidyltransferase family protein [Candidatus Dormibacteraeota bacterium]|nr:nucleotidyltransferase family protein [Candidatus Dormibacteraeota bacterium]